MLQDGTWTEASADARVSAVADDEKLVPKIISFDAEGRPLDKQESHQTSNELEVVQWSEFMRTSECSDQMRDESIKALILDVLHGLSENN